ncbi:hypothetical protein FGO68_gene10856 [Halteria grandinella]|uniref:Uncharacterized protein n=1 Tax=Halteria grandinella TaxID=5974 RepID=A0A8J8TAE3_HALGN|nr:hypothetical protein FGO68_gene10856 [Halteria grandinella]
MLSEEEKKNILGDLYEKLQKSQQSGQHQSVLDHTDKILQVDSAENQPWARQARLTALIKTKNFEQALELIKGREKQHAFEHAYILHRQGKNKEAIAAIKGEDSADEAVAPSARIQVTPPVLRARQAGRSPSR